jgi:putative inorganic carbon (hco3(-)) transporter
MTVTTAESDGLRHRSKPGAATIDQLYGLDPDALWSTFKAQSVGFKLACVYLILEYVRPQSIWKVLDFLPWTQITILIGLFAVLSEIGRRGLVKSPTNAQILLYTAIVCASVITAYSPAWSLLRWDIYLPWVVIYFFIVNAVVGRIRFLLFVILFLLCSFKMSQHGFRTWMGSGFGFKSWGVTGAPGFFHNSGEVGIQMCIFLPMSAMFLLSLWPRLSKIKRSVVALLPITAAATIIAANSRGAVLGGIAGLAWLALIGRSKVKAAFGFSLVALLGWLVAPAALIERFSGIGTDDTSLTRLTYWRDGLDIIRHHPLLGIGFENWVPYYPTHYKGLEGYYVDVQVCHNILIQAASELGIPGLVAFLVMVATTFVLNARTRKIAAEAGDDFLVRMAHGFDAAMIGFLVSAQFITVLYYPYFWVGMPMTVMLYTAAREAAGVPFTSRGVSIRRPQPGGQSKS